MSGETRGAGRPPAPEGTKAVAVTVRLPPWLVEWLRAQDGSQAQIIADALIRRHRLKAPE